MNATSTIRRTLNSVLPSFLAAALPVLAATGDREVNVIQTGFVPRIITNVIEMRVPTNIFVTVYRTNQFEVLRTNVFDVYRTNLITRYQTNVNTLTLTNWETVLVFKTNRFTQPITNLVQIEVPTSRPATVQSPDKNESKGTIANVTAVPAAAPTDGFLLEAARTAKPSANGQAEITLKLKSTDNETPTLHLQEWQVERTDRSVLLFGRGPEFKRELPLGTYKVEVKTRATESSPIVRVRRNFEVTRDEVILQKVPGLVNAR